MANLSVQVKCTVSPFINLLYPLWYIQTMMGFTPYVPKWAIKTEVVV